MCKNLKEEEEIKRVVLISLSMVMVGALHAGWWKTYGPGGDGHCVQLTSDGNYIISGQRDNETWLLKVDTAGDIIWSQVYDGGLGKWIEETSDGNIIIAGIPDLMMVSAQGDSLWSQDYGIASKCVQETSEGGYIVTGSSNDRLALVKTNAQGDSIWSRFYTEPGNNLNRGYFVQITNDGGYIVTGMTGYADEEYGDWLWTDIWLLKTDGAGNKQWSQTYSFGDFNEGNCVRQTADDGYVIVGIAGGKLTLLLTDSLGDTLSTRLYSSDGGGLGFNVSVTADSCYIVTGITTSALYRSLSPAYNDLWLLKTNKQGDTVWTRTYGGDNSDAGRCVQQTTDGGYIIVGTASSFGPDRLYLLKTDSLGLLGIDEKPISEPKLNWKALSSVGDKIVLYYSDMPEGFQALIFDATGRKVDELHSTMPDGVLEWGRNHNPGVYFIRVESGTARQTQKVVLVK